MAEGVLKPETWAAMEDPFGHETDDEDAEEFQHLYYIYMRQLAKGGNPWAQKEYDMMLRKMKKSKAAYKDAFENEDLELMATSGYEGYVAEGLDLGITFDPEDKTNHRYAYLVAESDWQASKPILISSSPPSSIVISLTFLWSTSPSDHAHLGLLRLRARGRHHWLCGRVRRPDLQRRRLGRLPLRRPPRC